MKRRYRTPPIQEAVCEIHFEVTEPFPVETIKTVSEGWKGLYPNQQLVEEKNLELRFELGSANVSANSTGSRMVARSADGTKLVQLSSRFLAVNQLSPYPGWIEGFRADILARFDEASPYLKAEKVCLINLRYIDRLNFPQRPLVWRDWLNIDLPIAPSIPATGGVFQSHYHQDLATDLKGIFVTATLPQEKPDMTTVILDNLVLWQGSVHVSELGGLLDRVHAPLPVLFDELLTEKTQELIGGYEEVG